MFLWCLSAKKERKPLFLLVYLFELTFYTVICILSSSPPFSFTLSFLMEPLSLFLRLIPSSTQLSPRVTDFLSLTPCLTTSPCASLRLPRFIFVTQSFLRSLFPCLTQSLSILISLSLSTPPLFSVSMSKIFLFVRVLRSLFYLFLSPFSYLSDSQSLFFVAFSVSFLQSLSFSTSLSVPPLPL